jgi:hypothetical protein
MHSKPVRPPVDNGDGTHTVILTRGKVALVDSADAAFVGQWNWCAYRAPRGTWYAVRTDYAAGTQKTVRLHRALLSAPDELEVDHRNGDSLDNRRGNLRLATTAQNCQNARRNTRNTSGFKGVYWSAQHRQWVAAIYCDGRKHFLGLHRDPASAHAAYCEAAARLHGEFANVG